jgi:hypothetical protein
MAKLDKVIKAIGKVKGTDLNMIRENGAIRFERVKVTPKVVVRGSHTVAIVDHSLVFADYDRGFIAPELEVLAAKFGGYWEWETPESISLTID